MVTPEQRAEFSKYDINTLREKLDRCGPRSTAEVPGFKITGGVSRAALEAYLAERLQDEAATTRATLRWAKIAVGRAL